MLSAESSQNAISVDDQPLLRLSLFICPSCALDVMDMHVPSCPIAPIVTAMLARMVPGAAAATFVSAENTIAPSGVNPAPVIVCEPAVVAIACSMTMAFVISSPPITM
jgi:hypothetical protein